MVYYTLYPTVQNYDSQRTAFFPDRQIKDRERHLTNLPRSYQPHIKYILILRKTLPFTNHPPCQATSPLHNGFNGVLRIAQRNRACPCPPVRPRRLQSPAWYPPPSAPVCRNVLFSLYDISACFAFGFLYSSPRLHLFIHNNGNSHTYNSY